MIPKQQLLEIIECWEKKICPDCKRKLSKLTQSHDPAFTHIGHGRMWHSYDLWCCNKHGAIFTDDPVIGLSYSPTAYQCPQCGFLIYPKEPIIPKLNGKDSKTIRDHLRKEHNITGEIGSFVYGILMRNSTKTIKLEKKKKMNDVYKKEPEKRAKKMKPIHVAIVGEKGLGMSYHTLVMLALEKETKTKKDRMKNGN